MVQKIICIDDDPIALLLSKLVISKTDFKSEIITVCNGQEALNYLNKPQVIEDSKKKILILLDLNMPVMDGWEFLEQFSQKLFPYFTKTKIILLSSSIDPNDIQKSKNFSMVIAFLPKPLTKEILNMILENV